MRLDRQTFPPTHDPVRHLRRCYGAVVSWDGAALARNTVIDPVSGEIVAALPPALVESEAVVLHAPDESMDSMQVMMECRVLDRDRDAACDRLLIYHGRAEGAQVVAMSPSAAKWGGGVLEIQKNFLASPLARSESRLCRLINSNADALASLVRRMSGLAVMEPKAVGVDDLGMDVRTRTGVVRIEFEDRLTVEGAEETIEGWLRKS